MSIAHVGIDLHKQTSQVAVLSSTGELTQHRLVNDRATIEAFFRTLPRPAKCAIEATGTWAWLVDLLQDLGHDVALSHPKQTRAIAAARLKTDRVDAQRLALLLRADLLPTVWIPPREIREGRELVRHRIKLTQWRTRVHTQLAFLLNRRNLQPQQTKRWSTQHGLRELEGLSLGAVPKLLCRHYRWLLTLLNEHLADVEKALAARWGDDPRVRRLQTIPGIGPVLATLIVVELGEIDRFPGPKQLASYMGLAPRVRASGGTVRIGHISKEGNTHLRWALTQAALQAGRQPGPLRTWARLVASRRGRSVARIAVARKLVRAIYEVWKHERDYTTLRWGTESR